jgi:hypothetical protein
MGPLVRLFELRNAVTGGVDIRHLVRRAPSEIDHVRGDLVDFVLPNNGNLNIIRKQMKSAYHVNQALAPDAQDRRTGEAKSFSQRGAVRPRSVYPSRKGGSVDPVAQHSEPLRRDAYVDEVVSRLWPIGKRARGKSDERDPPRCTPPGDRRRGSGLATPKDERGARGTTPSGREEHPRSVPPEDNDVRAARAKGADYARRDIREPPAHPKLCSGHDKAASLA